MSRVDVVYGRSHREIEQGDIDAATRGLRLRFIGDGDIAKIKAAHADLDYFASAVIVKACEAELERRG